MLFVGWIGKRLFVIPKAEKSTNNTLEQNASPVLTQNFQPVIHFSPTVQVDNFQAQMHSAHQPSGSCGSSLLV